MSLIQNLDKSNMQMILSTLIFLFFLKQRKLGDINIFSFGLLEMYDCMLILVII